MGAGGCKGCSEANGLRQDDTTSSVDEVHPPGHASMLDEEVSAAAVGLAATETLQDTSTELPEAVACTLAEKRCVEAFRIESCGLSDPRDCAEDCSQILRRLFRDVMLWPCKRSTGYPLSCLFSHAMECKHALAAASDSCKQATLKFLLGLTVAPDTHRQCYFQLHGRAMTMNVCGMSLTAEKLHSLPSHWQQEARKEVWPQGKDFRPGSAAGRVLVGAPSNLSKSARVGTDVHVHVLAPANPEQFSSVLNFGEQFLAECHTLVCSTPLGLQAGSALLSAFAALLPETAAVLHDLLTGHESEYIIEDTGSPGVLKHTIRSGWNLSGIKQRFGKQQYELFRDRPTYTCHLESRTGGQLVALALEESGEQSIEACFFTACSGKLVWADSGGLPVMRESH
eukprot:TRINITY_DN28286_c0_g1_i1.p1 TRINITY_DN28286_c0_g1~~TRINITY_DN28286_c0_g1_i1.p1  ORF type:complete len:404 (+),score=47.82 TRINITY_DN28286_c0_g1_i1:23-1213(+)